MAHKLFLIYSWWVRTLLYFLPDIPVLMRCRGFFYSLAMKGCGRNFQVSSNVIIKNLENFSVGSDVYIAPNVVVNAIADVDFYDEVMIGFNSVVVSGNHTKVNGSYRFGKSSKKNIKINRGAWVGANCTITAGSEIPSESVVAANSCTSTKFLSGNVIAGVPAKIIK